MRKITDIPVTRYRTIEEKDASGRRTRRQVPYTATRKVTLVQDGKRLLHFFIDSFIFQLIASIFNFVIAISFMPYKESVDGRVEIGFQFFAFNGLGLAVIGAYYILFEYFFGKTPGKFITGTQVINVYGKKPGLDSLTIRTLSRFIPFEGFSCIGGRGWHDKFSETYVVNDKEAKEIQKLLAELPPVQPA